MDLIKYILAFLPLSISGSEQSVPKIAIVGGGIGGTSCAYFLKNLLGEEVEINLYEASKIGGRLAIEEVEGSYFEAGGAVIHPRNKYMNDFVQLTGLSRKTNMTDGIIGLYNGNTFSFIESTFEYVTMLKMWWHYGMDLLQLRYYIDELLDRFENIYELQKKHHSFVNVHELLHAMDPSIPSYLTKSVQLAFEEKKFNEKLIRELVFATIRVNYGQTNSIHQFVASVSVAGAMDGLWAVEGGNYQVTEKLLNISGATLINEKVNSVQLIKNTTKFNVITDNSNSEYDIVIMATPLTSDARLPISFDNFPTEFEVPGLYHNTVCTFVTGILNNTFFHYDNFNDLPNSIFSITETTFYNSISQLKWNSDHSVYKVFSQRILTEEQLNLLFKKYYNSKVIDWLAYPHYTITQRNDSFILHKNLYYINAIEWAASAMEMSAIGGKNVALLVYNDLIKTSDRLGDTVNYVASHAEL